jgi:hypothetical protein
MYHLLGTGHKSVDEGVKEAIALWEETLEVRQVKGSLRSRAEDSFESPYTTFKQPSLVFGTCVLQ